MNIEAGYCRYEKCQDKIQGVPHTHLFIKSDQLESKFLRTKHTFQDHDFSCHGLLQFKVMHYTPYNRYYDYVCTECGYEHRLQKRELSVTQVLMS